MEVSGYVYDSLAGLLLCLVIVISDWFLLLTSLFFLDFVSCKVAALSCFKSPLELISILYKKWQLYKTHSVPASLHTYI